jgi:medium-chain acyl-[acyl-carrier-protein] hydrolase
LCPIRLPGRESRIGEEPFRSLSVLLEHLAAQLRSVLEADGPPYVLLGSCSGAIIAYELARCLQAAGPRKPSLLVVAAQTAPHLPEFASAQPLHALPGEQLRQRLLAADALPQEYVNEEELWLLVEPAIRADFQMVEHYRHTPDPHLEVPILALRGDADLIVSEQEMAAWSGLSGGGFRLERLSGGLHDVLRTPTVLADTLAAAWRRLAGGERALGARPGSENFGQPQSA